MLSGTAAKGWAALNFSFRTSSGDGYDNLRQVFETSIPDVLGERASLDPAFTFIDYDQDWAYALTGQSAAEFAET